MPDSLIAGEAGHPNEASRAAIRGKGWEAASRRTLLCSGGVAIDNEGRRDWKEAMAES